MIRKRGARWRVVVQAGRDPITRQRLQLSGSAATERDAVRLERDLRLQAEGRMAAGAKLAAVVEEWWASRPKLAPTTAVNYRHNLESHILPVLGARKLVDIRPRLIAAFLQHLEAAKGLSPATVRKVRTVLSTMLSYAVAMEYIESNPVMKVAPPAITGTRRVAPTVEETARILLAAEEGDADFAVFLWVAAEEGGRRGETLALRWRDIDLSTGRLTIERTVSTGDDGVQIRNTTKSGQGRTIAISAATVAQLLRHKGQVETRLSAVARHPVEADPEALVFSGGVGSRRTPVDGRPWRPESTSRRFRMIKQRAGVRADIDLHGLRHTMITEMLAAGVDPRTVMGRAGHRSQAMTMTVYAKVRPAVDAAAAELWGQILESKLKDLRPNVSREGSVSSGDY